MAPGFNALAQHKHRIDWPRGIFAGEPIHHFSVAVVGGAGLARTNRIRTDAVLLFAIMRRCPRIFLGLEVAEIVIDFVVASVFKPTKQPRLFVNFDATVRLRRIVMGLALALALLVCAGLVLLGGLLVLLR